MEDISFLKFIEDYRNSPIGYSFLNVLEINDRVRFCKKLNEIDNYKKCINKTIKFLKWIEILQSIKLNKIYKIYRSGYNNYKTKYHILFEVIYGKRENSINELIMEMRHLSNPENIINILIEEIDLNGKKNHTFKIINKLNETLRQDDFIIEIDSIY